MADVKTNLRELSVAVGIKLSVTNNNISADSLTMSDFVSLVNESLVNKTDIPSNLENSTITSEYTSIINNGLKLGRHIAKTLKISSEDPIVWCGFRSHSGNPADIKVGDRLISLKEESFILENMGLYKFLSLITTKTYKRGLHVFKTFANKEFNNWFDYTWKQLGKIKTKWNYNNGKYFSSIEVIDNIIELNSNGIISKVPTNANYEVFNKCTTSKTREKVFCKWINEVIAVNDPKYIDLKNICSTTAGQNMCTLIKENISSTGLKRFLQIRETEYYYGKSTFSETTLLKVPSSNDFNTTIELLSVDYSVPKSQLNVITTLKNKKTSNIVRFRNECRYSHGQFNGTPEAKMYYIDNLTDIYEKI